MLNPTIILAIIVLWIKMNEFSKETSCVLHCRFYRSNFDVIKCGSAYIWSHEK